MTSPVVPDDLAGLRLVGSPVLLADRVIAVVQTVDADRTRHRARLAAFDPDAPAEPRWLTDDGAWVDSSPVASADGRVAFLSTRSGRRQAYVLTDDGAAPLAEIDGTVTAIRWLDAARLVAIVERPDPAAAEGSPIEIDWLRYKSDGRAGFREPTSELWLLGPDGSSVLSHRPSGRITQLAVAGERAVAVIEPRHSDDVEPVTEIRGIDPAGSPDDPGTLLWSIRSSVTALTATAVSSMLIAVTSAASGQSVDQPTLWLLDGAGGARPIEVGREVDCERAIFSDGRPTGPATLLQPVVGTDRVLHLDVVDSEQAVFAVDPITGESARVSPAGWSVTDFGAGSDGRVALCLESATTPTELFVTADGGPRQLSRLNSFETRTVRPEQVRIATPDGLTIDALLYRAADPAGVLIRVHGGPHGAYGNTFDLETQADVAAGFTVLAPNFRGSAGRGSAFRAMSVGEWGRGDYADLVAVSDWAVASGLCRADSLYLAGGSYGGYLINWALTQTDRYRAAISERSVSNLMSKWGTSDNGYTTNRFEFGGLDVLDDSVAELVDRSPLRHAARITTPLLLLHGEADYRCPIEQSEQLFVALRRLGRECVFVRFPGASHGFAASGRPDHRIRRLELIIDWLRTH